MEKLDFTIAVAVYNVASYLEECVESIIRQLGGGIELLLVDDGPTDSCGAICDRYAQKDSRITLIHQENGGLPAARNTAMERASGEWIIFVDGDDRPPENALSDMKQYSQDIASHGEVCDPLLMKGLNDLCIDALGFCFMQTLLHTDCLWTRKERLAWLRELAEYDWVKAVQGYDHATLQAAILRHWRKKGSYRKINLCCRVLRPFVPLLKRLGLLRQ